MSFSSRRIGDRASNTEPPALVDRERAAVGWTDGLAVDYFR
jgi:alkylhydroperoxidase family enzyme